MPRLDDDVDRPVAARQNTLTRRHAQRFGERGRIGDERVILAVLAARIDAEPPELWQALTIELPEKPFRTELA